MSGGYVADNNGSGTGMIWETVLRQLELETTRATFQSCFAGSRIIEVSGKRYVIGVKGSNAMEWLEHRFKGRVMERLAGVVGGEVDVAFVVEAAPAARLRVRPSPPTPRPEEEGKKGGLMTAYEVMTREWPEPVWAVPGKLPTGLAILAGRQKIGKSWLAMQLAQAVSVGGEVFGQKVEPGRFLYLSLEDHGKRLRDRMEKQRWALEERLKKSSFMLRPQFDELIGDLGSGGAETLAEMINRFKYRLVVVDTFSRAIRGDQNDNDMMTMALSPIQEMAYANNCVVLLLDHHRKLFSADPDLVVDILGSTAKAAVADTIWGFYRERGKTAARLAMIGRDFEEQTLMLQLDPATGLWLLDGNGDAHGMEITGRRQEILDALADLGRARVDEIARAIEQNRGNTYTRLQDMVGAGLVRRETAADGVWYGLGGAEEQG